MGDNRSMNTEPARPAPDSPPATSNTSGSPDGRQRVGVRRSPKFANFAMLGALLGAVVAFILTVSIPRDLEYARANGFAEYSQMQIFGFLLLIGVVVGVAIALTIAILLDRRSSKKRRYLEADRVDVHEAPAPSADIETDAVDAASAPALEQNPPQTSPTTNEGTA